MDPIVRRNAILLLLLRRRRQRREHRFWVRDLFLARPLEGAFETLVQHLRDDPSLFENYHRLTTVEYDRVLIRIAPRIERMSVTREALPTGLKLSLTLRFLAAGESMVSMSYQYRISKASVSRAVSQTCWAIWEEFKDEVLRFPDAERLREIADGFEARWDFPNCVGAIDGKHVVAKAFDNSGSTFFNYHRTFSTVLMACCDDRYRFTFVHVGAAGRESDGGIFRSLDFGKDIMDGRLPLPGPLVVTSAVGVENVLPPVFVGDAAFPLCANLMRPFGNVNLKAEERIFNYRLSRARRIIENTFGILAARFQIFRKTIQCSLPTLDNIVRCCVVLHNMKRNAELHLPQNRRRYVPAGLVDREVGGEVIPGRWRAEGQAAALVDLPRGAGGNATEQAKLIRGAFAYHFMKGGSVPFQWGKLPDFERQQYIDARLIP